MDNLKKIYETQVIPKMKEEFGYKNNLTVPRPIKVTLNVGIGQAAKDPNFAKNVEATLERITGQKPVKTLAKKSIAAFKIRKGGEVGIMVTLRGKRMYDFLTRLVNSALPRVRDFRGLNSKGIDGQGNFTIGLQEHIVFPEIESDEVERIHSLEMSITTTAKTREEGVALFKYLGFPFAKNEEKNNN